MSIYHLPHGQYGYSRHVLNLPQDISSFFNQLPHSPADLDVIIVQKEGATNSHKDFRVTRLVVLQALQWLIANNTYYKNITINHSVLDQLPLDAELTNLPVMRVSSSDEDIPARQDEDPRDSHLGSMFVPLPSQGVTDRARSHPTVDHAKCSCQLAYHWWEGNQWVYHRRTHVICLPYLIPNWSSWLLGTETAIDYHQQLLPTPYVLSQSKIC